MLQNIANPFIKLVFSRNNKFPSKCQITHWFLPEEFSDLFTQFSRHQPVRYQFLLSSYTWKKLLIQLPEDFCRSSHETREIENNPFLLNFFNDAESDAKYEN